MADDCIFMNCVERRGSGHFFCITDYFIVVKWQCGKKRTARYSAVRKGFSENEGRQKRKKRKLPCGQTIIERRKIMKKKVLSLLLVSAMLTGLTACGGDSNSGTSADGSSAAAGSESTEASDNGGAAASDDNATYTYNLATDVFPTNWNPFVYETNTAKECVMDYTTSTLYYFDYNETMDGYALVPRMAVGEPEDVTADYVGKYGVEEGDTAKVWKITLRDDLKWEDGTPITAQSYVNSAKLLLDPVAKNSRADDYFYGSSFKVVNAKNYLYAGTTAFASVMTQGATIYYDLADLTADENGVLTADGKQIGFYLDDGAEWGSDGLQAYYDAYGAETFTVDGVDQFAEYIQPAADEDGFVLVTEEVRKALSNMIAILHGSTDEDTRAAGADGDYAYQEWEEFCYFGESYPEMDFSEVGIFALSDYELCYAIEAPLEGFYLKYAMPDVLVYEELYKQCESVVDGVYNNTYGTSAETYKSYGPYVLSGFQMDKEIQLTRNENFFGLEDGKYQTTNISIRYVGDASTRLQMFLSGQLDSYGLTSEDMEAYSTSDWTYYSTGASTFFVAMNPDMELLKTNQEALGANYNKTILTVKEFRQALSYSLDRAAFALASAPTNSAAYGMYSSLIIYDPDTGATYRGTDEAKQVLVDFWGLADEIGDGKMYATMDDAIDSITGYNLTMAREYFDKAYDIAIADGLMDEDDTIEIKLGMYNNSNFQTKGAEFLQNNWIDAVKGTKLEGKLTFTTDDTISDDFGGALRECRVDMLFGVGFSGSALDPYNLIQCYTTDDSLRYNTCWDTENEMLTVELNGTKYTASVADWTYAISGETINMIAEDGTTSEFRAGAADDNAQERFKVLTAIEGAVLDRYELLPLIDDNSASLKSMQTKMYSEEYIFGVGFNGSDGVEYLTYNYNDAEWDEFVASQGGTLTYN